MQQSRKLQEEDSAKKGNYIEETPEPRDREDREGREVPAQASPVQIRPIPTYNDWIVILQDVIDTGSIAVPSSSKEFVKLEGMVIGVPAEGNGLPDGAGGRLKCQVKVGDKVMFQENTSRELRSSPGTFWANKKVIVVSERNLVLRLPPVPFTLVKPEQELTDVRLQD